MELQLQHPASLFSHDVYVFTYYVRTPGRSGTTHHITAQARNGTARHGIPFHAAHRTASPHLIASPPFRNPSPLHLTTLHSMASPSHLYFPSRVRHPCLASPRTRARTLVTRTPQHAFHMRRTPLAKRRVPQASRGGMTRAPANMYIHMRSSPQRPGGFARLRKREVTDFAGRIFERVNENWKELD